MKTLPITKRPSESPPTFKNQLILDPPPHARTSEPVAVKLCSEQVLSQDPETTFLKVGSFLHSLQSSEGVVSTAFHKRNQNLDWFYSIKLVPEDNRVLVDMYITFPYYERVINTTHHNIQVFRSWINRVLSCSYPPEPEPGTLSTMPTGWVTVTALRSPCSLGITNIKV